MIEDDDPQETAEWLDALDGVIQTGRRSGRPIC